MKPPYCKVCHRPHWNNQPHLGSPGDWSREAAEALGIEIPGATHPLVASVAYVADSPKESVEATPAQRHLLDFLRINPGAEQKTIRERVRARWQDVRHALTELVEQGKVTRTGAGTSKDGYRYQARERN